ncbi:MAG: class I SAM-dependent methyltransferase [Propionibacterium sp.]|nr:class I SAM-dependent methyltransferase [Propionibacterium sp.]
MRRGDVADLPFDDDSFDVVHAHQVLQHVGDPWSRCAR